ncbi:MAG TPA: pyridoxal phosphate-dependent aminotransferase, partial [Bacteroidales bacterium]|nr:pyridoxal phosphate-dependent aminotransferase [Bacteroidales bacterium]
MKKTPIPSDIVKEKIKLSGLRSVGTASIRQIKILVDEIEKTTGEKFIRMEMGIPGLPPVEVGIQGQIAALKDGVASIYPDIQGIPELKAEISRFVKLFMNIDVGV